MICAVFNWIFAAKKLDCIQEYWVHHYFASPTSVIKIWNDDIAWTELYNRYQHRFQAPYWDVGCGEGSTSQRLHESLLNKSSLKIDLGIEYRHSEAVRAFKRGIYRLMVAGDYQALPLKSKANSIFAFNSIYYGDDDLTFSNLASCLNPGGLLAFNCYIPGRVYRLDTFIDKLARYFIGKPYLDPVLYKLFFQFGDKDLIERLAQKSGFEILEIFDYNTVEKAVMILLFPMHWTLGRFSGSRVFRWLPSRSSELDSHQVEFKDTPTVRFCRACMAQWLRFIASSNWLRAIPTRRYFILCKQSQA